MHTHLRRTPPPDQSEGERCRHCDGEALSLVRTLNGPHYGWWLCGTCHRRSHWAATPWTPERARRFQMPFGKYRGQALGDVFDADPGYVEWAARELDGAAGRAAALLIGPGPGGRHA